MTPTPAYPDDCIRGISNPQSVTSGNTIASDVFYFWERDKRSDGWIELSVNWHDDDGAIEITLAQRKENGEIQFKYGLALLPRSGVETIMRMPGLSDMLTYERRALPDNPYHGNLLLREGVEPAKMKQIAGTLALYVVAVIPRASSLSERK